jgi:transcriptional regulator with XRE-family HTH domain|nr:MAG TPA: Repressor protein CI [Bacteriophage sp.]
MTDDREETKRIFAKNLNKYIALNQKQQIDVAKDLNEKPTTLNMWCKGNSLPSTGKLRKIADYFNIGMTDLIEEKQFEDTDDEYSDIVMKIGLHDERFKKFIIKYDKLPTDKKEVLCDFFEKFID